MVKINDFDTDYENKWCPGCGNFGILTAMKSAFVQQKLSPDQLFIISGIGQAAKTPHFMTCNMFHTLHGRALPIATGAKIANHNLNIIVNSGDGDCYGEGGNHFISAVRRNVDITLLVHNNKVYGLTKGQASPTSDMGMITKIQRYGVISEPFQPLAVALSLGAGFVARGFAGNTEHLAQLIVQGMNYKGFSLIDILQPCVSFNKVNTYSWYQKRVFVLEETGYQPDNFEEAYRLSRQWGDQIPIGLLYKKDKLSLTERIKVLSNGTLISQPRRTEQIHQIIDG